MCEVPFFVEKCNEFCLRRIPVYLVGESLAERDVFLIVFRYSAYCYRKKERDVKTTAGFERSDIVR